jgi:protein FrlC
LSKLNRNQLVGMNIHYGHYPLLHFLDTMVKYGFRNIELWGGSPHFYVDETTAASDLLRIKKEAAARDLEIVCFTPEQVIYPINLAAKEIEIRERSIDYFIRCAEAAKELGAPRMLVTPGWGYENEPRQEAWQRAKESLAILSERAEAMNLLLLLEPLTRAESNVISDMTSLKAMLGEVASSHLTGMVDTIPMAESGLTIRGAHEVLKEQLAYIHFIDGPDGHLLWGEGTLPLESYIHELNEIGYEGYLSFEYTSVAYFMDPDTVMVKTLERLAPFLND